MGKGEVPPIIEDELAELTAVWSATDKPITALTGIELCSNLKSLYLANKISDISPLASLTNLTSVDLNGNELNSAAYAIHIPALESNGTVVQYDEQKPWDVTSDGVVSIFDLVAVAHEFGQSGDNLDGDVNGDGVVNIFDLILVAAHFGE